MAEVFYEKRGSASAEPIMLPWLDAEKRVFIAVNRFGGDDIAIALDYRSSGVDPAIVANDWHTRPNGCIWREVAPSLSAFVGMLWAVDVA
jgi:hypothetical protein